jgi:hypothetical protein
MVRNGRRGDERDTVRAWSRRQVPDGEAVALASPMVVSVVMRNCLAGGVEGATLDRWPRQTSDLQVE